MKKFKDFIKEGQDSLRDDEELAQELYIRGFKIEGAQEMKNGMMISGHNGGSLCQIFLTIKNNKIKIEVHDLGNM